MRKDSGKEGRQKVAVLLRRLKIVAAETDIAGAETVGIIPALYLTISSTPVQTRENIDKYCETFEQDILKLFDKSYRKGDPKMMHVRTITNIQVASHPNHSLALCSNTS
jgi:exocyst complex component 5